MIGADIAEAWNNDRKLRECGGYLIESLNCRIYPGALNLLYDPVGEFSATMQSGVDLNRRGSECSSKYYSAGGRIAVEKIPSAKLRRAKLPREFQPRSLLFVHKRVLSIPLLALYTRFANVGPSKSSAGLKSSVAAAR